MTGGSGFVSVTKAPGGGWEASPAAGSTKFASLTLAGTTVTHVVSGSTSTGTLAANTISWATGPLAAQTWTADWVVSGHFLYYSTDWPYPRLNASGNTLTSDRSTATVGAGKGVGTQILTWTHGVPWAVVAPTYSGTLTDNTLA